MVFFYIGPTPSSWALGNDYFSQWCGTITSQWRTTHD